MHIKLSFIIVVDDDQPIEREQRPLETKRRIKRCPAKNEKKTSRFGTFYFEKVFQASKNAHIIENPRSIIVTKVGVAEGFKNIKNLEDESFALSESKASILLRLKDNFDRISTGKSILFRI